MNRTPPSAPVNARELASPASYFDLSHRVTPDEIDDQQHVHNLRYLQWCLWAAGRHTESLGWDSKAAHARGVGWVVREHSIQYRSAAVAGDEILVRTWVADLQRFASRRRYLVCRPSDRTILARVETRWVFVNLVHHRAMPIPEEATRRLVIRENPPPLPWENGAD